MTVLCYINKIINLNIREHYETANTNHQIQNVLALQQEYPEQFLIINQSRFNAKQLCSTFMQKLFNG